MSCLPHSSKKPEVWGQRAQSVGLLWELPVKSFSSLASDTFLAVWALPRGTRSTNWASRPETQSSGSKNVLADRQPGRLKENSGLGFLILLPMRIGWMLRRWERLQFGPIGLMSWFSLPAMPQLGLRCESHWSPSDLSVLHRFPGATGGFAFRLPA